MTTQTMVKTDEGYQTTTYPDVPVGAQHDAPNGEGVQSQLALIQAEIASRLATQTGIVLADIEHQLQTVYATAEAAQDDAACRAVEATWNNAQLLVQNQDVLMNAAVSATHALKLLETEHEDLVDALEDHDDTHPLVGTFMETARDEAYETAFYEMEDKIEEARQEAAEDEHEYAYEQAWENLYDDLPYNLERVLGINGHLAQKLTRFFVEGHCPSHLQPHLTAIGDAITAELADLDL